MTPTMTSEQEQQLREAVARLAEEVSCLAADLRQHIASHDHRVEDGER